MKERFFLNKNKYNSLGFVEALIAIMVSGVVATVLINISVSSMRELVKLDIEDTQANYAKSYAVILQNIANEDRVEEEEDEFDLADVTYGSCYRLEENPGGYALVRQEGDRDEYKTVATIPLIEDEEERASYFGLICIEEYPELDTSKKLLVDIIIGFNKSEGDFTTANDIRDYEYYAIINL